MRAHSFNWLCDRDTRSGLQKQHGRDAEDDVSTNARAVRDAASETRREIASIALRRVGRTFGGRRWISECNWKTSEGGDSAFIGRSGGQTLSGLDWARTSGASLKTRLVLLYLWLPGQELSSPPIVLSSIAHLTIFNVCSTSRRV